MPIFQNLTALERTDLNVELTASFLMDAYDGKCAFIHEKRASLGIIYCQFFVFNNQGETYSGSVIKLSVIP